MNSILSYIRLKMPWNKDSFASLFLKAVALRLTSNAHQTLSDLVTDFDESELCMEVLRSWFRTEPTEKKAFCGALTVLHTNTTHIFNVPASRAMTWATGSYDSLKIAEDIADIPMEKKTDQGKKFKNKSEKSSLGEFVSMPENVTQLGDPELTIRENLQRLQDDHIASGRQPTFPEKLEAVLPRCFAILWSMKDMDWFLRITKNEKLLDRNNMPFRKILLQEILAIFRSKSRRQCELTVGDVRMTLDFHYLSLLQSVLKEANVEIASEVQTNIPELERHVKQQIDLLRPPESLTSAFTRMYLKLCIHFSEHARNELHGSQTVVVAGATEAGKSQQIETLHRGLNLPVPSNVTTRCTSDVSINRITLPGVSFDVVDTPGLFDPNRDHSNISYVLMSSMMEVPVNIVYNLSACASQIERKPFDDTKELQAFLKAPSASRGRLLINVTYFDEYYNQLGRLDEHEDEDVPLRHAYTVASVMQRIIFPEKEFFLGLDPRTTGLMYTVNVDEGNQCIQNLKDNVPDVICTGNNFKCAQAHLRIVQQILKQHNDTDVSHWEKDHLEMFARSLDGKLNDSLTLWDGLATLFTGLVCQRNRQNRAS